MNYTWNILQLIWYYRYGRYVRQIFKEKIVANGKTYIYKDVYYLATETNSKSPYHMYSYQYYVLDDENKKVFVQNRVLDAFMHSIFNLYPIQNDFKKLGDLKFDWLQGDYALLELNAKYMKKLLPFFHSGEMEQLFQKILSAGSLDEVKFELNASEINVAIQDKIIGQFNPFYINFFVPAPKLSNPLVALYLDPLIKFYCDSVKARAPQLWHEFMKSKFGEEYMIDRETCFKIACRNNKLMPLEVKRLKQQYKLQEKIIDELELVPVEVEKITDTPQLK